MKTMAKAESLNAWVTFGRQLENELNEYSPVEKKKEKQTYD
jgi:hypothetical protein